MDEPRLHRRTIAKGVAWSVPVITVVTTAPAIAASPTDCALSHTGLFDLTARVVNEGAEQVSVDVRLESITEAMSFVSTPASTVLPAAVDIFLDAAMSGVVFTRDAAATDPGWGDLVLVEASVTNPPGVSADLRDKPLSRWRLSRLAATPTNNPLPFRFTTRLGPNAFPDLPYDADENTLDMNFGRQVTATDAQNPECTYNSGIAGGPIGANIPPQAASVQFFGSVVQPSAGGPGTVKLGGRDGVIIGGTDTDSGVSFTNFLSGITYSQPQLRVYLPVGLAPETVASRTTDWSDLTGRSTVENLVCEDGQTRPFRVYTSDWKGSPQSWVSVAGRSQDFMGADFAEFAVTASQLANPALFTYTGGRPRFYFTQQAAVEIDGEFFLMGEPAKPELTG